MPVDSCLLLYGPAMGAVRPETVILRSATGRCSTKPPSRRIRRSVATQRDFQPCPRERQPRADGRETVVLVSSHPIGQYVTMQELGICLLCGARVSPMLNECEFLPRHDATVPRL